MNLCWIRRDLRLHDHAALAQALKSGPTLLVFIFDQKILQDLPSTEDARVSFIYDSLREMETRVQKFNSSIIIAYGDPVKEIPRLAEEHQVTTVFFNRDYEPYAKNRDQAVAKALEKKGISFVQTKDLVIFEKEEVLTGSGEFFKVFTPYKNKWLTRFEENDRMIPDYQCDLKHLVEIKNPRNILDHDWYQEIGFTETPPILKAGTRAGHRRLNAFSEKISHYHKDRDYPARAGTSLLSVYIRHGNISIREMLRLGTGTSSEGARTWVSELIWRDFYQMVLDAHPEVVKHSQKPQYRKISWPGGKKEFIAWCEGKTGYPIVDAAMRCMNQTGQMHNRLRMIVASFLCKTLLVNWQWGEKYFAQQLLDFDLAANNGGWQWSASTGTDAQPYFRIFNPKAQSERYDPEGEFIRKWVPELAHLSSKEIHHPSPLAAEDYPPRIVSYEINRSRALALYQKL